MFDESQRELNILTALEKILDFFLKGYYYFNMPS